MTLRRQNNLEAVVTKYTKTILRLKRLRQVVANRKRQHEVIGNIKGKVKSSLVGQEKIKSRTRATLTNGQSMHSILVDLLVDPVDAKIGWDSHDIGWLSTTKLAIAQFQLRYDAFQAAVASVAYAQHSP